MRQGKVAAALRHLTEVYRASDTPALAAMQVEAAWPLGVLMREMGDFDAALALDRKKMDWDAAHDDTLALSTSTFLQAETLSSMRNFEGAIAMFRRARALSLSVGDLQGVAFEDTKICQENVSLDNLASARRDCAGAARVFAAAGTTDMLKETQSLVARIDMAEKRPSSALVILNQVLDHGGWI
jgi:tetratricopeptide (TPR) repeat protein